jgi:hypothetical protein
MTRLPSDSLAADTYADADTEARPASAAARADERAKPRPVLRAAARGAIAAMAMSGLRRAMTAVEIVEQVPPDAILEHTAPRMLHSIPPGRRRAVIEFAHWMYGAGGGIVYGMLPYGARRRRWVGPVYGVLLWGVFQAGVAPALKLPHRRPGRPAERLGLLADHLLYGVVLGASLADPRPPKDSG